MLRRKLSNVCMQMLFCRPCEWMGGQRCVCQDPSKRSKPVSGVTHEPRSVTSDARASSYVTFVSDPFRRVWCKIMFIHFSYIPIVSRAVSCYAMIPFGASLCQFFPKKSGSLALCPLKLIPNPFAGNILVIHSN